MTQREDILVCAPTVHFADDVKAKCSYCGVGIVHRPHAAFIKTKICMACAADLVRGSEGRVEVRVTEETRREVATYFGAKGTKQ